MDWIVKKASALSPEEQAARGITGIPQDWPIEMYPYTDTVPEGFEQLSDFDLELLKTNHQAEYDAWYYSLQPLPPQPAPSLVTLSEPKDEEGRQFMRIVSTESAWHYSPRSLDFYSSKYESLFNRTHLGDGTVDGSPDIGDAWLVFYNAANEELTKGETETAEEFQIRLTATCTKTIMSFENTVNYGVFGAKLMIKDPPATRAYLWAIAAPDVPKEYGGNVCFMGGGMNLSFFANNSCIEYDGKTSSEIAYDGTYHSGKIIVVIKHAAGVQIGIQFILQYFSGE